MTCKKKTIKEWKEYVSPIAISICAKYKIPWQAAVAITALETGWGSSNLYCKNNNWGGVKFAGSGAPTYTVSNATEQTSSGKTYNVPNTKWACWSTKESGFEGWCNFFHRNKRYKEALKDSTDPYRFAYEIRKAGYATDPNYVGKIHSLLKRIFPDTEDTSWKYKVWSTEIGSESSHEDLTELQKEIQEDPPTPIKNVEEFTASGVWQIIKLMTDRYSLSKTINDATISRDQGSLINFMKKVIQEPWLQFSGDTYGDQYYFTCNKEPYDKNGFKALRNKSVNFIEENEVIADDLNWYDGSIYTWFEVIPQGSFLGQQNRPFIYTTAVFFEEYAQIWGSKPLSIVNNYINFLHNADGKDLYKKSVSDLRYLVESNVYLPFTRQGSITINGRSDIKRDYLILYEPTKEFFIVDGVSHNYRISDRGEEVYTTLKVSRGMDYNHVIDPKDRNTKSYWNLILYGDEDEEKDKEEVVAEKSLDFYFDNDRSYLINLQENWPGAQDTRDKKMENQVNNFPNLRGELNSLNVSSISQAAITIKENPECKGFKIYAYIDSDFGVKNTSLPKRRCESVKSAILSKYKELYPSENIESIASKISLIPKTERQLKEGEVENLRTKAYQRSAVFLMEEYKVEKQKKEDNPKMNWKVNRDVFNYFLNRKQKNNC